MPKKIFITGSADGLGKLTAATLLEQGHEVKLHVRSNSRISSIQNLLDAGATVAIGDLSNRDETIALALKLNEQEHFDSIIHNAGVYKGSVHEVNVIAPYILTALMHRPQRLIYLSSGLHSSGQTDIDHIDWNSKNAKVSYSDSKLHITAFSSALARLYPEIYSNSVNPGWVPTKMGGSNATDDLTKGHQTQEWLATADDAAALTSGGYWFHQKLSKPHAAANDTNFQNKLIASLAAATGYSLPEA